MANDELGPENFTGCKVVKEVAEVEFARFVQHWDIDANTDIMSSEDREGFDAQKARIVWQIMDGNATVDEKGNMAYALKEAQGELDKICFRVPRGSAYMRMDQYKERQGIHKMYAFMGEMTGQTPKVFSTMDARDTKFCLGIATLFLAS